MLEQRVSFQQVSGWRRHPESQVSSAGEGETQENKTEGLRTPIQANTASRFGYARHACPAAHCHGRAEPLILSPGQQGQLATEMQPEPGSVF